MTTKTKVKLAFGTLNITFLGIAVAAGLNLMRQSQEIRGQADETANIRLKLDESQVKKGLHFAVIVEINTAGQPVHQAKSQISYDPNLLQIVTLDAGMFFHKNSKHNLKYDNQKGLATIDLYQKTGQALAIGEGDLAIIVFKPIKTGTTQIKLSNPAAYFDPTSANIMVPDDTSITKLSII